MVSCQAVSLNPPTMREMTLKKMTMPKMTKGGIETSSEGQVASDGEEGLEHPHTQDTLTGISQVFSEHEDTDPESEPREKIQSIW